MGWSPWWLPDTSERPSPSRVPGDGRLCNSTLCFAKAMKSRTLPLSVLSYATIRAAPGTLGLLQHHVSPLGVCASDGFVPGRVWATSYAGVKEMEEYAMDATPRPFTGAEYNVREGMNANIQYRQEVPMLDYEHFTGVRLQVEPSAALRDTPIQQTTTLVQS